MGYSKARGTLIYEKNLKSRISCRTPFNAASTGHPRSVFMTCISNYITDYNHNKTVQCQGVRENLELNLVARVGSKTQMMPNDGGRPGASLAARR
jgi:hypothetical protein